MNEDIKTMDTENLPETAFEIQREEIEKVNKTGFAKFDKRTRIQQAFNRNLIEIKRNGKKINLYDYIQENGTDCAINDVINKYGTGVGINKITKSPEEIITDFGDYNDLMTFKNREIKAEEMFNSLPVKIKQQFNNSKQEFMDKGLAWAQNLINEEKAKTETQTKLAETTTTTTEE